MTDVVRELVSKKKMRYKDGNFNLDLSYITDRIIAMGFPAAGAEGLYRNSWRDVKKFLDTVHQGRYRLYNLCSERKYDHSRFEGRVEEFPFEDHNPPPFLMIQKICESIKAWLDAHPENVVAIHCKAGKGRTGTIIAAYLLFEGRCKTSAEALNVFAEARTKNRKGVTIPSQRRYVDYFDQHLHRPPPTDNDSASLHLMQITLSYMPDLAVGADTFVAIHRGGRCVYYSKPSSAYAAGQKAVFVCDEVLLSGDVTIEFFNKKFTKGKMFGFAFNVRFIKNDYLCLNKMELDKACKMSDDIFNHTFRLEAHFAPLGDSRFRGSSFSSRGPIAGAKKSLRGERVTVVEPFAASVSIGFVFPCESCKKPIDIANETDVYCYKGAYTHWGCLKCSRCLRSLGSDFLVKEEKLVCTHCDRTFFDECAHCRRALTTQHVTEHGRMWHPDCFIAYTLTLLPPGEALPKITLKPENTNGEEHTDDNMVDDFDYGLTLYEGTTDVGELNLESLDAAIAEVEAIRFSLPRGTTASPAPLSPASRPSLDSPTFASFPSIVVSPSTPTTAASGPVQPQSRAAIVVAPATSSSINNGSGDVVTTTTSLTSSHAAGPLVQPDGTSYAMCASCGKDVTSNAVTVGGRVYHDPCFCCSVCFKTFDHLLNKNGRFYCEAHHEAQFGSTCSVCKGRVTGEFFALGDRKVHRGCLRCATCQCDFSVKRMVEHQGVPYCQEHYAEAFMPRCRVCKKIIAGPCFTVADQKYHQACLRCTGCQAPLQANGIYLNGINPVCVNCVAK